MAEPNIYLNFFPHSDNGEVLGMSYSGGLSFSNPPPDSLMYPFGSSLGDSKEVVKRQREDGDVCISPPHKERRIGDVDWDIVPPSHSFSSKLKDASGHAFLEDENKARAALGQAAKTVAKVDDGLDELLQMQRSAIRDPSMDNRSQVQSSQAVLREALEREQAALREMYCTLIMSPKELHFAAILGDRLQRMRITLQLCEREMGVRLSREGKESDLVALVLHDAPVSQVVFKGKTLEDSLKVALVRASDVNVSDGGDVKAALRSNKESAGKGDPAKQVQNNPCKLNTDGMNIVSNIKINISTRMSVSPLHLSCPVTLQLEDNKKNSTAVTAVTPIPYEIVAITNESQWLEAEGKLLCSDIFSGTEQAEGSVSWPLFANILHRRFLKATRQPADRPTRPIHFLEWQYFHERYFFSQNSVSKSQVLLFWAWFGGITQSVRFKRHVNSMWYQGFILAIITKEECNAELHEQKEGTFIVRFSESYPGLFAVAYVSNDPDDRIKHCLVKPGRAP